MEKQMKRYNEHKKNKPYFFVRWAMKLYNFLPYATVIGVFFYFYWGSMLRYTITR